MWYIGSHWAVALIEKWYTVTILDNLSNSSIDVLDSIEKITGTRPKFYEVDLRDKEKLENVFKGDIFDWVIHFAWAKAVWESCDKPFYYYKNNVIWSLNLFECMEKYNVKNIIFSSSATVYKPDEKPPFTEQSLTWNTTNPYGTTKLLIENILRDLSIHKWFNVINLRYFNPIWAHSSGLIWEDPNDIPNNLLPFIMKVASWELSSLNVFWDDYDTIDWTWERDYIHVNDLIEWHIKALSFIEQENNRRGEPCVHPMPKTHHIPETYQSSNNIPPIFENINLWTWKPTSVLEVIKNTEEVTWKKINYTITPRRAWDIAISYCLPTKAKEVLNWETKKTLQQAIKDSWNFKKR